MSAYGHNKTTKKKKSWNVKESKIRPEEDSQNRIDLIPAEFDRLIKQKGVVAKIYRTLYCPNVKSVDGAEHEIDCTLCNGSGFLDVDPICCHVFIQTQELNEMPNIEGFVDGNTVLMTFPIGVEVQYFTKVELHDFTDIVFDRVNRRSGSLTDVQKYPVCRVNLVVDKVGKRYYQDSDFMIDFNGNIKWLTPGDQQAIVFSETPVAGAFTISFGTETTSPLPFDASAATIQAALRGLEGLENVLVTGDAGSGFKVVFVGVDSPVIALTSSSTLTDANDDPVSLEISNTTTKINKPNDNQPYSIHYEAKTQFRTVAAVHANRFTQYAQGAAVEHIKMNEQWYAKKEFLPKRLDLDGNELQQGPFGKHTITGTDGEED